MANRKFCKVNFSNDLKKIGNILVKSLETDGVKLPSSSKQYIQDGLKEIHARMREGLSGADDLEGLTMNVLKGQIQRDVLDIINTYKAAKRNADHFDLIAKKAEDEKGILGAITTLFQEQDIAANAQKVWYWNMIDNAWRNLDTAGVKYNPEVAQRATKLFNRAMFDQGEELMDFLRTKGLEDPDMEIYMALKTGTHRIAELDMIARVFRNIDDNVTTRVRSEAPYFNKLSEHVLPLKIDVDKIQAMGKRGFVDYYVSHASRKKPDGSLRDDAAMAKSADMIYENAVSGQTFAPNAAYKSTTNVFGFRKIHFDTIEAEWNFIKKFGRMNDGIIGGALKHRERLLKNVSYSHSHGPNINFSLYSLREHILKNSKVKNATAVHKRIQQESEALEAVLGRGMEVDETTYYLNTALQDIVSYGLTGSSAIRNLTFDQTIYTGLMSHMLTGRGQIEETGKAIWALMKNMKNNGRMDELVQIFESQGIMTQIENALLYKGHLQETMGEAALNQGTSKAQKYLKKGARFAASARQGVSKWSAADRMTKASRTSQAVNSGKIIMNGVDKVGWGGMSKGARNVAEQAGFDSDMWSALKKVKRIQHDGKDVVFDTKSFKDIPDKDIMKFKKGHETIEDARRRLKYSYQVLHNELLNHLTSVTSKRGHITSKTSNPKLNIFIQAALRFSNIGLSQWYNMHRLVRANSSLDPNAAGEMGWAYTQLMFTNPRAFFTVAATNMAGGYMILWAGDMLTGNTPREISLQNSIYALAASGAGGLLSLAYMQLFYNNGNIGTPISAFVAPVIRAGSAVADGNFESARRNMGKASQVWLPGANMWWTREAYKRSAEAVGHYDPSPAEKRYDKEVGRKDKVDDILDKILD